METIDASMTVLIKNMGKSKSQKHKNEKYWKDLLKWVDDMPDKEFFRMINKLDPYPNSIPLSCRHCPNHPSNGGSSICHCILGTPVIY